MRSILDKLRQKTQSELFSRLIIGEGIEVVSDEMALQVRGGDKDYSPTYERETEQCDKFTNPSILLKM